MTDASAAGREPVSPATLHGAPTGPPAVEIVEVTKMFRLYREKVSSAKERIIKLGRLPYEPFYAVDDVSFDVPEGTTAGLLGHNGSGKSTLLKCIAGTLRPTSGTIRTRGRLAALLELGAGFHPDLTGRENVYLNGSILGFTRSYVDRIFDEIVDFSEIGGFIDNQVKHYSSGMVARLGFAVAVNVDPDVILVDEVLSVGDEAFQRKCIDRVKRFQSEGRTIVLVTHAAELVRQICDRAVVLDHGNLVTHDEPGPAIRAFRETLIKRGIDVASELIDDAPEAEESDEATRAGGPRRGHDFTRKVRFTDVSVEYPGSDEPYAKPGGKVVVRCGYEATERVDDVVFAINVHDVRGMLLVGANTAVLDQEIDVVEGPGEVVFDIDGVPLLDGTYDLSLGIHNHSLGVEYDQRYQLESFEVMNPYQIEGSTFLPLKILHHARAGDSRAGDARADDGQPSPATTRR